MDLSIIIVNWKVKDRVRRLLESLFKFETGLDFEVFVVDNDSRDGTPEMVRTEFPQVKVIANNQNFGFAKANNQAIKQSRGDFVLLLNPDMLVKQNTLRDMIAFMREPHNEQVGIAGCKLVNEEGELVHHVRRFPSFADQLAIMLKVPHLFPKVLNAYLMKDFDYTKEARVDSVRGAFFMIRRTVLEKIGLLDEGFFIWYEEVDFCKRAKEVGFEVVYTPSVECVDFVGQSFKQVKFFTKQKMLTKSMIYYMRKHAPPWQWITLASIRPLALAFAWMVDALNLKSK